MASSGLLSTPKMGRSRFSKALPAPPPGLDQTANDTVPFPPLPNFPPRKQSITMATTAAPPTLAPASIHSPLPALPTPPVMSDSASTYSAAPSSIRRKPVRKPVAAATIAPTPRQMKRVSSISSLLSAYSHSSTDSLHRSSRTSDGSKASEPSPSSVQQDDQASSRQMDHSDIHPALRPEPDHVNTTQQGYGAVATHQEMGRPTTPSTQHRANLNGGNVATSSPSSVVQDTPHRREIWRRRASSNRSDRSITVADLKLAVSHGHTTATTTAALNQGIQAVNVNRSVDEKPLPQLSQGRGAEPGGSTSNTLPFRDLAATLPSLQTQNSNDTIVAHERRPPPPPPKQYDEPTSEEPRPSDATSIPGSVLGDILSNYNFPTPPLGESNPNTPRPDSEAVVKKPDTVRVGRKPVGSSPSPPASVFETTADKHPTTLTPGTARQEASIPPSSTNYQLEVKGLPKIPGVGLRPGDKNRSPAVPMDKSPYSAAPPAPSRDSDTPVSPVAEEMDKIKSKFKAFVHKHTKSTEFNSIILRSKKSTPNLADESVSPTAITSPVMKDLPVIPGVSLSTPQQPSEGKFSDHGRAPSRSDAPPASLPKIETSPTGDLMPTGTEDLQRGGLNVFIPQQQEKSLSAGSTTSLTTMQTSASHSKSPSPQPSDSPSLPQDRRPAGNAGEFSGARPRAGTATSIASNMPGNMPRGRGLRAVQSHQNLHGPPPAGFRAPSRQRGATNETLPPFAPSPMYNPFRQRPQTASGPAPKGPKPLERRDLYSLADSLSKNALIRKFHEERADSFPVREAEVPLTEQDHARLQSIRKLFPLQEEKPAPPELDIRPAAPISNRHYECWFKHGNWVSSHNEIYSVECQTCHKKEKDPRMVCCGCDLRICYDCYEGLIADKRDLRAMLQKKATA